jgi:hypothetical protein
MEMTFFLLEHGTEKKGKYSVFAARAGDTRLVDIYIGRNLRKP